MGTRTRRTHFLGALSIAAMLLLAATAFIDREPGDSVRTATEITPAAVATPGGVFITGHDPDFHAQHTDNPTGAQHVLQKAVAYVTHNAVAPTLLLVTSRLGCAGCLDPVDGLTASGFTDFDVADDGSAGGDILDLHTVTLPAYDAIVVASDFGGWLRQKELDVLNSRSADVISYVNGGGGLIALAESGHDDTTTSGRYGFLPFVVSSTAFDEVENGNTVTAAGAAMGLTNDDINGNFSHNVFKSSGGLDVIDVDSHGDILSLATQKRIGSGGVEASPSIYVTDVTIIEKNSLTSSAAFVVSLSSPPTGQPISVHVATADVTASASSDYTALPDTVLTWNAGDALDKLVTVPVLGDKRHEGNEQFALKLSTPIRASLSDAKGVATIVDEEGLFYIYVGDPAVVEGASGTTALQFPVTISDPLLQPESVQVKVATANNTATAGSDYTALALTTLTWTRTTPSTQFVTVNVSGDSGIEPNEKLFLNVSAPTANASISDVRGVGTILNDD